MFQPIKFYKMKDICANLQSTFVLPKEIKNAFVHDSIKKNHYSLNILVLLIIFIELFNISRVLFFSRSGLSTLNNRIYFVMYCTLLLGAICAASLERLLKNREKGLSNLYSIAALFWMVWHVLLNCYDLMGNNTGDTIVFVTALFGISVFIQMKPIGSLVIYFVSYLLFLSLTMSVLDFGAIVNSSISVIIAAFISITRYIHTIAELTQKTEIKNINQQLQREHDELRLSLEKHEIIMKQSKEVIFEWDISKDCLLFSQNCCKEFGCQSLVPQAHHWILEQSGIHEQDKRIFLGMLQRCMENETKGEAEIRIKNKSGKFAWYSARVFLQRDGSGRPIYGIGVFTNIDKQKSELEKLETQLQIDPLTGILNKLAFQNSIQECLPALSESRLLAMFMLDLDDFKSINDQYGHPCGDFVLMETAKAMQVVFRESDLLGRLGGDEFAVVLPDVRETGILAKKAGQLLKEVSEIRYGDKEFSVTCSIGITTVRSSGMTYNQLYKNADDALYDAKRKGKGCFQLLDFS